MGRRSSPTSVQVDGSKEPEDQSAVCSPAILALGRAERLAAVGQLAAGLAHEMNTPLGAISAHAEEALQLLELDRMTTRRRRDLRGRLLVIMRQAHRCGRIATRLLQFSQGARVLRQTSRPEQVIDEVIKLFGPTAQEKGVQLDRLVDGPLPDVPLGSAELEQLLVNLVQNGLDACRHGQKVRIQGSAPAGQLQIIVADTGCGIPQEHLERIFDPFFTTKPVGQGTGLGLSVCHGIVLRIRGSIEIQSPPGRGTRVTVCIPTDSETSPGVRTTESCPLGVCPVGLTRAEG